MNFKTALLIHFYFVLIKTCFEEIDEAFKSNYFSEIGTERIRIGYPVIFIESKTDPNLNVLGS